MRYIKHTFIVYTLLINVAYANELYKLDCKNITSSAQVHACAEEDLEESNRNLSISIGNLKNRIAKLYSADKKLGRKLEKILKKSQKSWEKHKIDYCKFEVFEIDRNNPSYTTAINYCHIRINDERTAILDTLYKPI